MQKNLRLSKRDELDLVKVRSLEPKEKNIDIWRLGIKERINQLEYAESSKK